MPTQKKETIKVS